MFHDSHIQNHSVKLHIQELWTVDVKTEYSSNYGLYQFYL